MANEQSLEQGRTAADGFRKLSEFAVEEILALPRAEMRVVHQYLERSGVDRYYACVYFFDDQLEVRYPIDRATYFLVARLRGRQVKDKDVYWISFPYRMVKGRGVSEKDGHEFDFYYLEGYACPKERKVYLSAILKGAQKDLLEECGMEGIVDRGFVGDMDQESYFDDLD